MKRLIAAIIASVIFSAVAHAGILQDKRIVDEACYREARIAHCGTARVGTGLLGCLQAARFLHLSDVCEAAIARLEADKTRPIVARRVIVVRPAYPAPGPGYLWRLHPRYGWGWYYPRLGWHRGWR